MIRRCSGTPSQGAYRSEVTGGAQLIKARAAEQRDFDAGNGVADRKQHFNVETGRMLLLQLIDLDIVNISDGADAQTTVATTCKRHALLKGIFANDAYGRNLPDGNRCLSQLCPQFRTPRRPSNLD
jgi:hypothetical protein